MARYSGVSRAAEPVTVLPQFRPQSQNTVSRVRARREKKSGFALSSPCPCPTDERLLPSRMRRPRPPRDPPPASGCKPSCTHRGVYTHPRVKRARGIAERLRRWLIRRLTDREKPVVKGTGCPIQWITVARLLLLLLLLLDPRAARF